MTCLFRQADAYFHPEKPFILATVIEIVYIVQSKILLTARLWTVRHMRRNGSMQTHKEEVFMT